MNATLIHRWPDSDGVGLSGASDWRCAGSPIVDLEGGDQPIFDQGHTLGVVQNGKIYNHHELREDLVRRIHRFATAGDTEALVHSYEEHGLGVLEGLSGMFALASWHWRRRRLLLARDRFEIKPLYYGLSGGALTFGLEL